MRRKLVAPGGKSTREYLRHIMADGRWRTSNDIVNRATSDGRPMTPQAAGFHMSALADEGFLISDTVSGHRVMWKALKRARGAK